MKIYLAQSVQDNEINTIGFYLTKQQARKACAEDIENFAEALQFNAGYKPRQIKTDMAAMTVKTTDKDYNARWQITVIEQSFVAEEIEPRVAEHSDPERVKPGDAPSVRIQLMTDFD